MAGRTFEVGGTTAIVLAIGTGTLAIEGLASACAGNALSWIRAGTGFASWVALRGAYEVKQVPTIELAIGTGTLPIEGGSMSSASKTVACKRSVAGLATWVAGNGGTRNHQPESNDDQNSVHV